MRKSQIPFIIISYDDGPIQDYTKAFPIHKKHNIPAETNVITSCINKVNFLSIAQLKELNNNGWEINSHSHFHLFYNSRPINNTKIGSKKIHGPFMYKLKNFDFSKNSINCNIIEKNTIETIRIIGIEKTDKDIYYAIINNPLRNTFSNTAKIRILEEECQLDFKKSKTILNDLGYKANHLTYPNNENEKWSQKIASQHFKSARSGPKNNINDPYNLDTHNLSAFPFDNNTLNDSQLEYILDKTKDCKGICILFHHTFFPDFSEERLELIIKGCKKRNIKISTRTDIFNYYNI